MRNALFLALLTGLSAPALRPAGSAARAMTRTSSSPASASRITATGWPPASPATARPTRMRTRRWRWPRHCSSTATIAKAAPIVRASIGRNRDQARGYPEPVSDLYRANARLARHLGFDREARTLDLRDPERAAGRHPAGGSPAFHRPLRDRRDADDGGQLHRRPARAEPADRAGPRRGPGGRRRARRAARRLVRADRLSAERRAQRADPLVARHQPGPAHAAIGARILLARVYRSEGDTARADALLAELGARRPRRRAPAHAARAALRAVPAAIANDGAGDMSACDEHGRLQQRAATGSPRITRTSGSTSASGSMPDGRVSGLEILRSGANPDWAEPLLALDPRPHLQSPAPSRPTGSSATPIPPASRPRPAPDIPQRGPRCPGRISRPHRRPARRPQPAAAAFAADARRQRPRGSRGSGSRSCPPSRSGRLRGRGR